VRGSRDEFDELAEGINDMLDRLERSMAGHRHAGDAIAHDLRSPVTRLRARLEAAYIDLEAGRGNAEQALAQALEDTDGVLKTFGAVLAIARLQAAGEAPSPQLLNPGELAANMAELYEPVCEDVDLEFRAELAQDLVVRGNHEFLAQALANILDNAARIVRRQAAPSCCGCARGLPGKSSSRSPTPAPAFRRPIAAGWWTVSSGWRTAATSPGPVLACPWSPLSPRLTMGDWSWRKGPAWSVILVRVFGSPWFCRGPDGSLAGQAAALWTRP